LAPDKLGSNENGTSVSTAPAGCTNVWRFLRTPVENTAASPQHCWGDVGSGGSCFNKLPQLQVVGKVVSRHRFAALESAEIAPSIVIDY
jgi:hypothetical protein